MKPRTLIIRYNSDTSIKPQSEGFRNIKSALAVEKILRKRVNKSIRMVFWSHGGTTYKFVGQKRKGKTIVEMATVSYKELKSEGLA